MHPGINDQHGEDCGSFPLIRGKERGHTHSEAMLSSLVHAFRQSSVKTLRRTQVCGSQCPNTTHLWSSFHVHFLFSVYFHHYCTSCLYCFCSTPHPPSLLFLFPSLGLTCHPPGPLLSPGLFSAFSMFLCVFIFLCISVCQ